MAKSSGKGNWVTINGTHVLIDGNKKIISGPKNLTGMTPHQAIESSKSSASKSPASKAMAKAKSDREADPSKKKKADGLVERAKRQQASTTLNSIFDNAKSTTKAKVAKNPNNRLHTGRQSSNGLNPKQEKLFNQYVKQGYSGNEAYKIATTGRVPSVQTSEGAVAPTSRQSNSATVSNTKTMGEFLRAAHAPATARTGKRGRNK